MSSVPSFKDGAFGYEAANQVARFFRARHARLILFVGQQVEIDRQHVAIASAVPRTGELMRDIAQLGEMLAVDVLDRFPDRVERFGI